MYLMCAHDQMLIFTFIADPSSSIMVSTRGYVTRSITFILIFQKTGKNSASKVSSTSFIGMEQNTLSISLT